MPEPQPPASNGQTTQTTRQPTLRLRLRQPSVPEGALLRSGTYAGTGNAPQVFQWVIHNELTPLTADLFILWAKLYDQPGSKPAINLWYDSALPAGRALQHFLEYRFITKVTGGESFKSKFLRHYLEEVFDEIDRGSDWPARLEGYLRSSKRRPADKEWLRNNELPAMAAAQQQQAELLTYIEDSLPGFTINRMDLRVNRSYGQATPESHWYRRYMNLVYQDNLPGWGKNLLIQHLINQGGLIVEAGALPPLNDLVYPGGLEGILGGPESTVKKVTGQLAVQQLLLKKLRDSLGLGNRRAAYIEDIKQSEGENYHGNHLQALADIDAVLASQVNQPNPATPSTVRDYFKQLDWSVDQGEGVKLANPGRVSESPVVILSERFAPFAQRVAGFTEGFLRLGGVYRRELDRIFETAGEFGEDADEIMRLRNRFLQEEGRGQNLLRNLDVSSRSYLADHPGFEQRVKTFLEIYADSPARSQADLKGEMTGMHLLINALPEVVQNGVRVFDQSRFDLQISYPSEAYALRSRSVGFVAVKDFKKLIILQLSDDAIAYKAVYDVIAKNVGKYGEGFVYYWARWKRNNNNVVSFNILDDGELILEGGSEFKADPDTEIMGIGHGSPTSIGGIDHGRPTEISGLDALELTLLINEITLFDQNGKGAIRSFSCKNCNSFVAGLDLYAADRNDRNPDTGSAKWKLIRDPESQALILRNEPLPQHGKKDLSVSLPVKLLYELENLGITVTEGVKARSREVVIIGGRAYLKTLLKPSEETVLVYRPELTLTKLTEVANTASEANRAVGQVAGRIRAWLGEDGADGPVFYRLLDEAPDGTVLNTLDFTQWHGEILSTSLQNSIRNIAAELASPSVFEGAKYLEDLGTLSFLYQYGDIAIPADISALILGMQSESSHHIVIADPDTVKVGGVITALDLAARSETAEEFIWRIKHHFSQDVGNKIRAEMVRLGNIEVQLARLKANINNDRFDFKTADITTRRGAEFVNEHFTKPFSVLRAELFNASSCSGTGNRRRRQICSQEEIEEQAREASEGLTLLSDDETRLLIGNSADDIALHTSEPDSVLAKVQENLHDFRRSTTSQRIAEHKGYHNIIALDSESFSAAQTLARNSNEEGRALLLQRNGERVFLTTEDGRVVTMVEGGAHNRITLVGETETFAVFTPEELAGGVRALAQGEHIDSVTVQPVVNAGEAFVLQESFDGLGVSDRHSPWREVTDTVRLHALENRSGSVVETGNMQVGKPGQSDTFLFDGDYVRNALKLGRRQQPGVLDAQLRLKRTELHEQGLNDEREVYQSVTVDYARKMQQLKAEFEVFRTAMDAFYEQTSSLSAEEHIPLLSTLRQEVEADGSTKWKMDFADRAVEQTVGTHVIEDERIVRYVLNHDEQIDQVRRVLKLNHLDEADINVRPGETAENFEGVDAPDGIALAMALQQLIELARPKRDDEMEALGKPPSADYQRALVVHQVIGFAFGGKALLGTVLDVGKYFAALSDGKVVTLPERLAA